MVNTKYCTLKYEGKSLEFNQNAISTPVKALILLNFTLKPPYQGLLNRSILEIDPLSTTGLSKSALIKDALSKEPL